MFRRIDDFRFWVQKVIPVVYDDSMSHYELLLKVIQHLNKIGDTQNEVMDEVENSLKEYGLSIKELQEQLDGLMEWFNEQLLPETMETILNGWFDTGKLDNVINEVLNAKLLYKPKQTELLNEAFRKIRNGENFKIIARGDSLTYGYDIVSSDRRPALTTLTDDGVAHVRERASISYPEALQKYMNVIYPNRATIVNQGYSGDTTESSYQHWFKPHGGDITLIMLGTNDSSQNKGIENFLMWYRRIIEREIDLGSAVILLTPPRRKAPAIKDDSYGNAVFQLGEEYGAPVVDMTELTSHMRSNTFSDGTHFNGAGYEHIGARLMSLFIGEGITNPTKVNSGKVIHGSRVANSLELINVSFTNSTGYPTPDEYTDGYGVGMVFSAGGKAVFSIYTESDDMLVYPSMYFPSDGSVKVSLDFGVVSQSVNNVYQFDQIYTNYERNVPSSVTYVPIEDYNWRINTKDAFYINGVTSLDEKKIHIPKRGWHTILVEADSLTLHALDFITYREMRNTVNTNNVINGKPQDLTMLNGWQSTNADKPPRVTINDGIAYVEGWVTKTALDETVMFKLPVAPYLPTNFKVTNGLTSVPAEIDPTIRVQQNGDVLLVHTGTAVNDTIVISFSFPIYYRF